MNPELALELQNRTIQRAAPYVERLAQQHANRVKDQSEAALVRYDAQFDALMDDVASDLFSGNAKLAGAAMAQVEQLAGVYLAELTKTGPDGQPLYGEAVVEKARQEFFRRAMEEGLVKWFRSTENISGAIMQFTDGELSLVMGGSEVMDVSAMLDPQARARVLRVAEEELKHRNTVRNQQDADATKLAEKAQEVLHFRMVDAMLAGALEPRTVREAVSNGTLDPDDGRALLTALDNRANAPAVTDDMARVVVLDALYQSGTDPTSYILQNIDRFSPADANAYLSKARSMFGAEEDGGLNSVQRRYLGFLDEALQTAGPAAEFLDSEAQMRITSAKDEYMQRVLEGEDAREVFMDLRERAQSRTKINIGSATDALVPPFYAVYAADGTLDISATAGATLANAQGLSDAQLVREQEAIERWLEAQQRGAQ
jgi:hypothetical protein